MITRWYHDKSDNSVVVGFQYSRDKVGNPNYELREHQSSYGDEYEYDNLYRLTRSIYDDTTPTSPTASPSATTTDDFDYDDIGNRETAYLKSANATTYLANPVNEYTKSTLSGTDSLYDSDAAGNLTRIAAAAGSDTDGDWRFYYDYENALTKAEKYVTDAWVTQGEYVRDANGRRVEKVADGTTVRYYYDGMRGIEETEGTGSPTTERQYVFGNGVDEALVMYDEDGEGAYDPYYYLADPLWTVEALVDEDAAIVEAYAYRAYGEPTIKTADGGDGDWFDGDETTGTSSAYGNTVTFTGRQYDPETAFYYYRARIYDPLRGRFINRDPIGYEDGMNLYHAYFVPDGIDPYGLRWKKVTGNVYCASRTGDDLKRLSRKITGSSSSWSCIRPLGPKTEWLLFGAEAAGNGYAVRGASVDVSNLTAKGQGFLAIVKIPGGYVPGAD